MPKAREIMGRELVGISKSTGVAAALKLANSAKVSIMPVIEDGKLCGIIFDTDLETHRGSDSKVGSIMRKPVFVEGDTEIERVSQVLIENGIGRVPVVESKRDMTCIGIVSSTEVLRSMKKSR